MNTSRDVVESLDLRTLGEVSLTSRGAVIPLDEPRLVALIVLLAIAGDSGVATDELLLRITPDETAEHGRTEIARLMAVARLRLGGESSIVGTSSGFALASGVVRLDVRVHDSETAAECADFLAGFRLPGSPEFREWLMGTRRRVEPVVEPIVEPVALPRPPFFHRRSTLVGLAAVLVIALGAYVARPRAVSGFSTGDPLLLADVQNETGDSVFDVGLSSAAAISLQQSGRLRLYSRSRLPDVYRLMQITNRDTALTFELAKDVAQRDGVRFVLGLQLGRSGDGYRVTGRLTDVSNPDQTTTVAATARSKRDVLRALDEVLASMRGRLGESRRDIEDRRVPLPYVTTSSLEALRSYGDGSVAWSRGDYALAKELWHRAVDIDTGFAMAYGALGLAYYFGHERTKGEHYFAEAFARSSRLSERELLRLQENAAQYRGLTDSAIIYSGKSAARFPSVTTWYNYGTSLMAAGRDSGAIGAFETALRYDPRHVSSYINLATVAKHMRRDDDALRYYARAGALDSSALYRGNINVEWASVFVHTGRLAEAESAFTRMARTPKLENRSLGLRSLGYLALWRGRTDDAIAFFHQAVDATVQAQAPLGELRNRLLLATAYHASGREREANEELSAAIRIARLPVIEPITLTFVATSCLKLGRLTDAAATRAEARARSKPDNVADMAALAYIETLLALTADRLTDALRDVRDITALPTPLQRLSLVAEVFRAAGELDSARVALERLRAEPSFGIEGEDDWLRAPLILGDVLLAQRDSAGAMKEYQRFLDQWRAAPPGLPDMVAARTRLAALRDIRDARRD